jgi:DNA-binding HxlR family transcriptional regulator
MPYQAKRPPLEPCPVEEVVAVIAGKWKARILYLLSVEPHTFSALKQSLNGITQQVLAAQLKALTQDGIVGRERIARGKNQQSNYSLTPEGKTLIPVLTQISEWGEKRMQLRGLVWNPPVPKQRNRATGRRSLSAG